MRRMLHNRGTSIALAMVSTALAVITLAISPAWLLAQSGSVTVFLDPATIDLKPGGTASVAVKVDASNHPIDTVQVLLDFDPSLLQVVDDAGAPSPTVSFGPVINDGEWRQPLLNQADNDSGRIGVAAGKGPPASGAPDLEREFVLAVINFQAVGEGAEAHMVIDIEEQESRLRSKAIFRGADVTGEVSGATIDIEAVNTPANDSPADTAEQSSLALTSPGESGPAFTSGAGPAAAEATPPSTVPPLAPDEAETSAPSDFEEPPSNSSVFGSEAALPAGIVGAVLVIGLAVFGVVVFLRSRQSQQLGGPTAPPG